MCFLLLIKKLTVKIDIFLIIYVISFTLLVKRTNNNVEAMTELFVLLFLCVDEICVYVLIKERVSLMNG